LKKTFFLLTATLPFLFSAQQKDTLSTKSTYVKANALFLPFGMLNAGIETQLSQKFTFQGDVFISPWKSFMNHEAQVYMIGFEGRYYFKEAFKHWYVGANISAARYILQKYNYWPNEPYAPYGEDTGYIKSNLYQNGYSFLFGATVGYQFELSENWNMDVYLGAGTSQGLYKGYDRLSGERYDYKVKNWNRSGEWIPYRGGVMISYKIK